MLNKINNFSDNSDHEPVDGQFLKTPLCDLAANIVWSSTSESTPQKLRIYASLFDYLDQEYKSRIKSAEELMSDPKNYSRVCSNLNGAKMLLEMLNYAGLSVEECDQRLKYVEALCAKVEQY